MIVYCLPVGFYLQSIYTKRWYKNYIIKYFKRNLYNISSCMNNTLIPVKLDDFILNKDIAELRKKEKMVWGSL